METQQQPDEQPAPPGQSLEDLDAQIEQLLAGENPSETAPPEAEEPQEGEHVEAAEMEPEGEENPADEEPAAEIDYDQIVPMPDGRDPIKLGELKDKLVDYERKDAELIERENRIMAQQAEVQQLMAAQGEIPPAMREEAGKRQAAYIQQQHQLMVEAIPEMQTRDGFARVRDQIMPVFEEYGVSADEAGQINDHRLIKIAYDMARLKGKITKAAELPEKVKKAAVPRGTPKPRERKSDLDKMIAAAKASNSDDLKYAAIDKLLES